MGLHATRITNNKRMLSGCMLLLHAGRRQLKTKNGSASLNCTNNIKRFYNARLHAIFKANGANNFMSLCMNAMDCISFIFMWSLFIGIVVAVHSAFDSVAFQSLVLFARYIYFSSSERIFRLPWFLFGVRGYIVMAEHYITSYIIQFFSFFFMRYTNSQDTCYNTIVADCLRGARRVIGIK